MRKYITALMLIAVVTGLSGCGSSHHHNKPSEASMFKDDTRVK
jgi:uncharacterized protein YceK